MIKLTASDASAQADFGWRVGVSGSELIVGAYNESTADFLAGAAYVYIDTDVKVVPSLSATGMVVLLLLLMTTPVVAGIYRTRRVERGS